MSGTEITVKNRAAPPATVEPEVVEQDIAALAEFSSPLFVASVRGYTDDDSEVALYTAEKWQASGGLETLRRQLDGLDKPATRDAIGAELLMLTCAFPNVGSRDLKVFEKLLAEDVAAAAPSRFALQLACRRLRRTSRFLPSIAETLEALAQETKRISGTRWRIDNLPRVIAEVRREVNRNLSFRRSWDAEHPEFAEERRKRQMGSVTHE
jgi:hypothetical protein